MQTIPSTRSFFIIIHYSEIGGPGCYGHCSRRFAALQALGRYYNSGNFLVYLTGRRDLPIFLGLFLGHSSPVMVEGNLGAVVAHLQSGLIRVVPFFEVVASVAVPHCVLQNYNARTLLELFAMSGNCVVANALENQSLAFPAWGRVGRR